MDSIPSLTEKILGIGAYLTNTSHFLPFTLDRTVPENFCVYEILPDNVVLFDATDATQLGTPEIGLFYHAILSKRQTDTPQAISLLTRELKIPRNWISYAGLKDAHAISHQRISIFNHDLSNIISLDFNRMQVHGFVQKRYSVQLGDLLGNYFKITLQDAKQHTDPPQLLAKEQLILDDLKNQINQIGFPNYFGLQRFGTQRPLSHLMGKFLLKKQWQHAVQLYLLTSSTREKTNIQLARQQLELTGDYQQFANQIPPYYQYERTLAYSLLKHPENYFRAINKLPKKILSLFVGSYQSYIFNQLLTHYLNQTRDESDKNITIPDTLPIIGSETQLADYSTEIQYIIESTLKQDGINQQNFTGNISWLKQKGQTRSTLVKPLLLNNKQLAYTTHKNGIVLEFGLPKGCYATMLLREFLKLQKQVEIELKPDLDSIDAILQVPASLRSDIN